MNSSRPAWTIAEAAERCGVSKSTIRRYRDDNRFPNAFKDPAGAWKIPIEDLLAVGWKPVDPSKGVTTNDAPDPDVLDRVRELEHLLQVERVKRESAERIAAMAEQSADDLRRAMRVLEAAPARVPEVNDSSPGAVTNDSPGGPRKRRWWQL